MPLAAPDAESIRLARELVQEERLKKLGSLLSTLRVLLVITVQFLLLLGFSFIYLRPPSPAFYIALFSLAADVLLLAGCVGLFFWARNRILTARKGTAP